MKLRDLVLHNFRLKVFSLLMAILIWEAIRLNLDAKRGAGPPPALIPAQRN